MKDFCILMQADDAYAPYLGVTLVSLFEHNSEEKIEIVIIDDNISLQNKEKINELICSYHYNVRFIEAENIVKQIKEYELKSLRNSYTTYLKLFVIEQLADSYKNVVYLDADTIITGSIKDLFYLDMQNSICGMAVDLEPRIREKQNIINPETWYNAGVIVFNSDLWKKEKCLSQIQDFIKQGHSNIYFHDQDILNFLFRDRITRIDSKYNFMTIYQYIGLHNARKVYGWSDLLYNQVKKSSADIRIYHCFSIMGKRPWNIGYPMEAEVQWNKYLSLSPWKDFEQKEIRLKTINKIQIMANMIFPSPLYILIYKLIYLFSIQRYRIK